MESQYLSILMKNADLNILEFDIQRRTELNNMKRTLPYYVMSYHKEGNALLSFGEKTYQISPGTVMFLPPNVAHNHYKTSNEETVFLWWHFTFEIYNSIDVLKLFQFPTKFQLSNSKEFERIFLEFIQSAKATELLNATILKRAKSLELLYLLLESALKQNNGAAKAYPPQNFIELLTRIIQYPEENISLDTLATEFHMHPTYICNRFKDLFGESPLKLQRDIQVEKSKILLRTSDLTITEIASELGFTCLSSFTRAFTTSLGISPSQYRKLNLKKRRVK